MQTTQTDPREVGGMYRSAYWGNTYTVLRIERDTLKLGWHATWYTCQDADGSQYTHCTPWDRRDTIITAASS